MITIGQHKVGNDAPCFITVEAGATHCGEESAKRLVSAAAEAGASAVKFQILDPDRLVADRQQMFEYEVLVDVATGQTETVCESLYEILCRRALTWDQWRAVKSHCDRLGLVFFATVGFPDEVDFLVGLGCHSIKIASGDVNHFSLIRRVARTGLNIQIDTGNATIGEIERAIDVINEEGSQNIIIHHCPSGYPARRQSINLNVIPTLKRMFPYPIAYSDHTPGWEMDIAAVALGANLVEKTITEDRTARSVEHIMSLEPHETKAFVNAIREVEVALGKTRRLMSPEEKCKRQAVRRSICAARDLPAERVLAEEDLDYRRPGHGIPPDEADRVVGSRLRVPLLAGQVLDWSLLER